MNVPLLEVRGLVRRFDLYLGALFRYTSQEKKKTELVILITPYMLTEKTITEIRKEHEKRLSKAGRPFLPTPN